MKGHILVPILVIAYLAAPALSGSRLPVPIRINGKPAQLDIDTGAERTCLFDAGARRLGLQVTPPDPNILVEPGRVVAGRTEECTLEIEGSSARIRLSVVTLPSYLKPGTDGVMGWDFLGDKIIEMDGPGRKLRVRDRRTFDVSQWQCWTIRPNARVLIVQIPAGPGEPHEVLIDTGAPGGVDLNPQRWQKWIDAHPEQAATLDAAYTPGIGLLVTEERWAPELALGGVVFREVPVSNRNAVGKLFVGDDYTGTLGLFALLRLSIVVDGKSGKVHVKSHPPPEEPNPYEYNRLGAVFVPANLQSNDLVAHVVTGSPAHEAGVRDGDFLLRIDDLDVAKWRTDPRVLPLSRFWSRPAGTTLQLGLKRNGQDLDVKVTLQNIFPD
ncbi:MAG: aspartyl protease family protein [Sedimentisphaerales bacterium]|nr:aspartyl protease family protein [Sedimentisphaerales bacterium]